MKIFNLLVLYSIAILFPAMGYGEDTNLVVRDAWIREAPPNAVALAGYMMMENQSNNEQSLIGATSDSFGNIMIHRTVQEGGMARMKHQKAVVIPAKGSVTFAPNSYHLMLMNPGQSLRSGYQVTIKLFFSNDSTLSIDFEVRDGVPGKKGESQMKCGAGKCGGSSKGGMKCGAGKSGASKGGMKCGAGKCGGM